MTTSIRLPFSLPKQTALRTVLHSKCFLLLALALVLPMTGRTQSYSIDWFTIDGGGGTSTGGVYTVSGTIGQPDAGVMTNGTFVLTGGFWGIIGAVQSAGAPYLTVARTATNTIVVSWPLPENGWKLQATGNLSAQTVSWTELPSPYSSNSTSLFFIEPTPTQNRFYRLHKP